MDSGRIEGLAKLARYLPLATVLGVWLVVPAVQLPAAELRGRIVDDANGRLLPARLYIQSDRGAWHFAESSAEEGSAVRYEKKRGESVEVHTTLSAHPFHADLPPGRYTLTVERGKEYHTLRSEIEIDDLSKPVELRLKRWIHMAARGWYSGETHVHRSMAELPNVVLAEDLNVALPLTSWVTDSTHSPATANRNREAIPPPKLIRVDANHLIWPINTEYEIFSVRGKRHTLGAVFVLNHTKPLTTATSSGVGSILAEARSQQDQVLLDLDKHNWPWSMMLCPIARVDLFELTNNHLWRTKFYFASWHTEYVPAYMQIPMTDDGRFTERAWIDFGLKTYYALLNCGFKMQPTAGTASGVHPVPLGFGRVYVQLESGLDYDKWIEGLRAGRSFVTTGPMLRVAVEGKPHGSSIADFQPGTVRIVARADSARPLRAIEVIVNGQVARRLEAENRKTSRAAFTSSIEASLRIDRSSWVAVRCFEHRPDRRERFAHTSPFYVQVPGRPLKPRIDEARYLAKRVEDELTRHRGVLSQAALNEFEQARRFYKSLVRASEGEEPESQ